MFSQVGANAGHLTRSKAPEDVSEAPAAKEARDGKQTAFRKSMQAQEGQGS